MQIIDNEKIIFNKKDKNEWECFLVSLLSFFSYSINIPKIIISINKNKRFLLKNMQNINNRANVHTISYCPKGFFNALVHYGEYDAGLIINFTEQNVKLDIISGSGYLISREKISIIENNIQKFSKFSEEQKTEFLNDFYQKNAKNVEILSQNCKIYTQKENFSKITKKDINVILSKYLSQNSKTKTICYYKKINKTILKILKKEFKIKVVIKKDLSTEIRKITYKVFNHSKNIKFFDKNKDKYENIEISLENKIDYLVKDFDIMDIRNCYDFDLLYLQISDIMI